VRDDDVDAEKARDRLRGRPAQHVGGAVEFEQGLRREMRAVSESRPLGGGRGYRQITPIRSCGVSGGLATRIKAE
jgi:hypothetical protein